MMMVKQTPQVDADAYDALTASAKLIGIWMTEARFDMSPQALDSEVQLNHSIRTHPVEVNLEPSVTIGGFIRFEATSRHGRRRVVYVVAKYFVSYGIVGDCSAQLAHLFVDRVGKLAAYPYFRALVASIVAQAGAQVPTLPILTVPTRGADRGSREILGVGSKRST